MLGEANFVSKFVHRLLKNFQPSIKSTAVQIEPADSLSGIIEDSNELSVEFSSADASGLAASVWKREKEIVKYCNNK